MTNSPPAQVKEWVAVVRIAKCSGDRRPITVDRCRYMHADDAAGIAALRNAAEELIRDARKWREHEELMMRFVRSEEGM